MSTKEEINLEALKPYITPSAKSVTIPLVAFGEPLYTTPRLYGPAQPLYGPAQLVDSVELSPLASALYSFNFSLLSDFKIRVQAELQVADSTRVMVCFRQGGWVGPSLPNRQQLSWIRKVQQSTPAWLDITVLDEQLRICRGNAGTTFVLLKRNDLNLSTFFGV